MEEWGIDISNHTSDATDEYVDKGMDIVITVCDHAKQICPVFPGVLQRIHWSIDDPFRGWDSSQAHLENFRKTRKEIKNRILAFLNISDF